MKVVALVQARMGSVRLPGKVMADILGKPLLWHIINRLQFAKRVDEIVIATTTKKQDEPIREMAKQYNIACFSGSQEDLIDRLYQAAKLYRANALMRVTADCPLVDPKIVDMTVSFYEENKDKYEHVTTGRPYATFPQGLDAEIFSFSLMERLWKEVRDPFFREWFSVLVYENQQEFKSYCIKNDIDLSHIRLTVDYKEDLELVRYVFERLYSESKCFFLEDILRLYRQEPERFTNLGYERDEAYREELKNRRFF